MNLTIFMQSTKLSVQLLRLTFLFTCCLILLSGCDKELNGAQRNALRTQKCVEKPIPPPFETTESAEWEFRAELERAGTMRITGNIDGGNYDIRRFSRSISHANTTNAPNNQSFVGYGTSLGLGPSDLTGSNLDEFYEGYGFGFDTPIRAFYLSFPLEMDSTFLHATLPLAQEGQKIANGVRLGIGKSCRCFEPGYPTMHHVPATTSLGPQEEKDEVRVLYYERNKIPGDSSEVRIHLQFSANLYYTSLGYQLFDRIENGEFKALIRYGNQ